MKKILFLVVLVIAGYFLWQKFFHDDKDKLIETSYEKPYVVVYGRDSCGWTLKYLSDLRNEGIEVIYKIVDNEEVSDEITSSNGKSWLRYNVILSSCY